VAAGRVAAARLLAGRADLTAIVAGNDMLAIGVFEALADAGRRCPADVSVVGHNDMPLVDKLEPPLTTVAIPQYEIGVAAAEVLLAHLAGARAPQRRLLETRLVVRGSTAPPAAVSASAPRR
jgi:LacI family transcriptional regulator